MVALYYLRQTKKIDRIIESQNIIVYADNYLLSAIFGACIENDWYSATEVHNIIDQINLIALGTTANSIYRFSPDPKDNYLFDLAVQRNCNFIVSDDKELREMVLRPI